MLVYNEAEPKKGKLKYGRRNTMDAIMTFLADIEKIVDAIFALVDKIMAKVDEFTAKDAE